MSKKLEFSDVVRQAVGLGIEKVARAVKLTLGPRGRNVIIEQRFGPPIVTKDGVTVAKAIELEDPYENLGARMLIEASGKTNDVSGDGTTTTAVLTEAIYKEGLKHLVAGANPVQLKAGIDLAVEEAVKSLRSFAVPVSGKEEIRQIATIAANGDETIGAHISEAVDKVGKDGVITTEESKTTETSIDIVDGTRFKNGFLSAQLVTDVAKQVAALDDPYILIYEKKILDVKALLPLLEAVANTKKPLLIIAEDLDNNVLATLVVNKLRGIFQSCAVKAPSFGIFRKDILQDIAAITGGQAITDDLGVKLEDIKLEHLGRAKRVVVTREDTTIVEGSGAKKDIDARVELIKTQQASEQSDFNRDRLQERLARLAGGVAVISIGATTESELKEKKYRIEDALQATQAAIQEGIVPGGGTALVKCVSNLHKLLVDESLNKDARAGVAIVLDAVQAPMKQIAENAGKVSGVVVEKVSEHYRLNGPSGAFGYNAATDMYEDLVEAGVVDPVKVTRVALENAASISGLLLTTDCAIVEAKRKDEPQQPAMPGFPMMG